MQLFIKKFTLLIPGICISISLLSQKIQQTDTIVYWTKNQRLSFDDFKGKPKKEDTSLRFISEKTLTHKLGAIIKSIEVKLMTEGEKVTFTIRAAMLKNSSWISKYGDSISLKHEQGHFDICEIYARVLRRDIKQAQSLNEAKEIFEETTSKEELEQDDYDRKNTFPAGGITHEWSEKIKGQLKDLENYEDPIVIISFNK